MRQLIFIFLFIPYLATAQYLIEGKVDTNLQYKIVHLDILDEWDQFQSVDDEMTVKSVVIDELGNFKFEGNELSEKQGFYRIRYAKKKTGFSINSSNHVNFIFSNQDSIQIQDIVFNPNNDLNKLLKKHIAKNGVFLKESLNSENERHKNLVLSKYQKYCQQQIENNNNGLLNLFYLATSQFSIQKEPSLFIKVHKELLDARLLPQYEESLSNVIHMHNFSAVEKKSHWLTYALIVSILANMVFILNLFRIKSKSPKPIQAGLLHSLTNKELEVLSLIKDKKSNKEIAVVLFISDATVKTHINNIYRKLNIKSRKEVLEVYNS